MTRVNNKLTFTNSQLRTLSKLRSKDRIAVAAEFLGFKPSRQSIDYHVSEYKRKISEVATTANAIPSKDAFPTKKARKEYLRHSEDSLRATAYKKFIGEIQEIRKLRTETYEKILVLSDTHAPYQHVDLLSFYQDIKSLLDPDLVINIGDELDNHAMSFHDSDPDLDSAGVELQKGRAFMRELATLFPRVYSVDSNHGSLAYRRQKAHGLPKHLILSYRDILFADRNECGALVSTGVGDEWFWGNDIIVNTPRGLVKFKHGEGTADLRTDIQKERMSVVRGHHHSQFNIIYSASNIDIIFGMTVGCGIDDKSAAFSYNKKTNDRPIIGCGAVIDGVPRLIPMPLDENGRYIGIKGIINIL